MEDNTRNVHEKNAMKAETLKYLIVQVLVVVVICLPTVFFILSPAHESHTDGNQLSKKLNKTLYGQNKSVAVLQCKSPLIFDENTWTCRPPCNWTSQQETHSKIYRSIMILSLWIALIATIITLLTWAAIATLRDFPHIVRFYMMISCVGLACANMLPLRVGLSKVYCSENEFWHLEGHSSTIILIQGGFSHYLTLTICFWSTCFVINTYSVIVLQQQWVFEYSKVTHLTQFVICWFGPAIIVICCIVFDSPAYVFQLIDFLTAQPNHAYMSYFSFTLPMQLTLGLSLVLLCSIVRFLRKVRHDAGENVIRRESESESLVRVERQFVSMTVAVGVTVGLLLSCKTVMEQKTQESIHQVDQYFICLLHYNTTCTAPSVGLAIKIIVGVMVMSPGFVCLFFFALLFMNKECRQVWRSFQKKLFRFLMSACRKQQPVQNGARSRCSSTLTFLNEKIHSDSFTKGDAALCVSTDKKPSKVVETRNDGLVTLAMNQLRSSRSNLTSDHDTRDEAECDETTALRGVDVTMLKSTEQNRTDSEQKFGSGTQSSGDSNTKSFYKSGNNANSRENLTKL